MIITYLDHTLRIAAPDTPASTEGYIVMDDNDLDGCFDTLLQGHDVWVRNLHGARYLLDYLHRCYTFVRAAGGLVEAPDGELLLIHREGHWDLPKGMVEPGETLARAACREVTEETGVGDLTVSRIIRKTYHIYDKYGGWHLKQTSWFGMCCPDKPTPHPQQEEAIAEACWVSPALAADRLQKSFATFRQIWPLR